MGDMAIRYRDKIQKTRLMICNIHKLGFDTSEYESVLGNIDRKVSNEIDTSYLSGKLVQGRMEQVYTTGMSELNKLWVALDRYSLYFEILNNCKYLDTKLGDNEYVEEDIDNYVKEMIINLKRLVRSDTVNYEQEKFIVEKVYDTAYNLIKLEIIINGNSNLYEYAKNEEVNISFFNELILDELDKLNLKDKRYDLIKSRLYKLDSNGLVSNYFDLELIKLLLVYGDNVDLLDVVMRKIYELEEIFDKYNKNLKNEVRYCKYAEGCVKKSYDKLVKVRRKKSKKFILLFLTYFLSFTCCSYINKNAEKRNMVDCYIKNSLIYSSLDGDTRENSEEIILYDGKISEEEQVFVRWYEPWKEDIDGLVKRNFKEYNVSHLELDTPYDYYIYGVDNYMVEPQDKTETYNGDISLNQEIQYKGNHIEVEIRDYEYDGQVLDEENYIEEVKQAYKHYVILTFWMWFISRVSLGWFSSNEKKRVFLISEYFDMREEVLRVKKDFKRNLNEYNNSMTLLEDIIKTNEEYRNKFNQLYEENKFLLANPEELYNRINSLEYINLLDEGKDIVKCRKKIK